MAIVRGAQTFSYNCTSLKEVQEGGKAPGCTTCFFFFFFCNFNQDIAQQLLQKPLCWLLRLLPPPQIQGRACKKTLYRCLESAVSRLPPQRRLCISAPSSECQTACRFWMKHSRVLWFLSIATNGTLFGCKDITSAKYGHFPGNLVDQKQELARDVLVPHFLW